MPDKASQEAGDKPLKKPETIPGPSTDPATNLMIADVVIRSISGVAREAAKKTLARKRFDRDRADQLVSRGSIGKTLLLYGASKIASRSLPGAVFVGGALLAKSALDRKKTRATKKQAQRIEERVGERHRAALLDEEK
ncbi:hypothetical protein [Altererythrobacter lutimaris]|uniref:Uncharacterized protein n=1 Tax=Altererythrobacter lutimaris TaxID=2743979 RepID=A0A850HFS9_9SPHN|nr:hypothetical protein [Altererythrobacter lutimaris]NVE95958.1 hypothetical protein [Altererythrobacter lutimaris]